MVDSPINSNIIDLNVKQSSRSTIATLGMDMEDRLLETFEQQRSCTVGSLPPLPPDLSSFKGSPPMPSISKHLISGEFLTVDTEKKRGVGETIEALPTPPPIPVSPNEHTTRILERSFSFVNCSPLSSAQASRESSPAHSPNSLLRESQTFTGGQSIPPPIPNSLLRESQTFTGGQSIPPPIPNSLLRESQTFTGGQSIPPPIPIVHQPKHSRRFESTDTTASAVLLKRRSSSVPVSIYSPSPLYNPGSLLQGSSMFSIDSILSTSESRFMHTRNCKIVHSGVTNLISNQLFQNQGSAFHDGRHSARKRAAATEVLPLKEEEGNKIALHRHKLLTLTQRSRNKNTETMKGVLKTFPRLAIMQFVIPLF